MEQGEELGVPNIQPSYTDDGMVSRNQVQNPQQKGSERSLGLLSGSSNRNVSLRPDQGRNCLVSTGQKESRETLERRDKTQYLQNTAGDPKASLSRAEPR
ncbi:unnamed protein product [Eretmochelys imbricata]